MAYDPTNPPSLVTQGIGGPTGLRWFALTWIDPIADVLAPGYIENASDVGMRAGDGLIYKDVNRGEWDHYDLIVASIDPEDGSATVAFPEVPEEALPFETEIDVETGAAFAVMYYNGRQVRAPLETVASAIIAIPTQAEAEAGTLNEKRMTPLRTAQAMKFTRLDRIADLRDYATLSELADDGRSALVLALAESKSVANGIVRVPRGVVRINTTIPLLETANSIIGEICDREASGGSEIRYYGTGPLFEIGTDNGQPWDASLYDGPQNHVFENLELRHFAADTVLGNGTQSYKAGSYAIRDWRGGGIKLKRLRIEHFEFGTWGVQSDLNVFEDAQRLYCKTGIYLGPRSDQYTGLHDEFLFCDTAIDVDQATQVTFLRPNVIGCGSPASPPVVVRKGTPSVALDRPWFEFFQGFNGQLESFVSAGELDGYDPVKNAITGVDINNPVVLCGPQTDTRRIRYLVSADVAAVQVHQPLWNTNNLLRFFKSTGTGVPNFYLKSNGTRVDPNQLIDQAGSGVPNVSGDLDYFAERLIMSRNARLRVRQPNNIAGWQERSFRLSSAIDRALIVSFPDSLTGGNTDRLVFTRRKINGTAPPTTNTWEAGDTVYNTNVGPFNPVVEWVCIAAGTPGTWRASKFHTSRGNTASRTSGLTANDAGVMYLDTTLAAAGKPIWWTGTAWADATGATV